MTRAERARFLADRYPASREPLEFFAGLWSLEDACAPRDKLISYVRERGPSTLRPSAADFVDALLCPECDHEARAGCLRPEGNGLALTLVCLRCGHQMPQPRGRCPGCGETDAHKLAHYTAEGFEHISVHACDSCRRYFHAVNLEKDPRAIPQVDEMAALPLDVWAREHGYEKLHPNLAGI